MKVKTCTKCGETKTLEAFDRNPNGKYGRKPACKPCTRIYQREYRAKNPTYSTEYARRWREKDPEGWEQYKRNQREKDPEGLKQYKRKWRTENKEVANAHKRAFTRRLRLAVLSAYGGRCQCCGETTEEFLTIDHVYNDGAAHRKNIGGGGSSTYIWLKRNGFPKDRFQLLCMNCNWGKARYGQCPHIREAKPAT